MEPDRTIDVEADARGIATIALDRPERRNAIDPAMMDELLAAFDRLGADEGVRAIVLRGNGKVFSAGGDLNWMRDTRGASEDEVARDSARLQRVYAAAAACPKMLVGRLHGAAMAGALGLVACCDVAIAEADTRFCLSEVRLGLAPGIIAGFLLPRIGAGWFRYLATGAVVFGTDMAARAGLVHEVAADAADLDARVEGHPRLAGGDRGHQAAGRRSRLRAGPGAVRDRARLERPDPDVGRRPGGDRCVPRTPQGALGGRRLAAGMPP